METEKRKKIYTDIGRFGRSQLQNSIIIIFKYYYFQLNTIITKAVK